MLEGSLIPEQDSALARLDAACGRGRQPNFKLAVSASLLLHAGLAGWMLNASLQDNVPEPAASARHYIELSVLRPRQQPASTGSPAGPTVPDRTVDPEPLAPLVEDDSVESVPQPMPLDTGSSAEENRPRIDPAQLNAAITREVRQLRSDLGRSWVAECMRQEEERGLRECPQDDLKMPADEERAQVEEMFRATVNAQFLEDKESRELAEEMERMRPLLDARGIVGELAEERYSMARARHWLLNPPEEEGGQIVLVSFGAAGVVVLHGLLAVEFDGTVTVRGKEITETVQEEP